MVDLQRNLLTTLLGAGIGFVVLTGVALALFLGRPDVSAIQPRGNTEAAQVEVDVPQTGLEEFAEYSAILEQPIFFSDRELPIVEAPDEPNATEIVAQQEEEPIQELEATVAGIVITPEMRLAMVTDKQAGKTLVLREGMSLEGGQAAWKLDAIESRQVSFVSVDGRETQLELKVNTSGLTVPPSASASAAAEEPETQESTDPTESAEPADARQASEEARARAEEIRRRVAERRAQLRAEAERRARQREQEQDNNG